MNSHTHVASITHLFEFMSMTKGTVNNHYSNTSLHLVRQGCTYVTVKAMLFKDSILKTKLKAT